MVESFRIEIYCDFLMPINGFTHLDCTSEELKSLIIKTDPIY